MIVLARIALAIVLTLGYAASMWVFVLLLKGFNHPEPWINRIGRVLLGIVSAVIGFFCLATFMFVFVIN